MTVFGGIIAQVFGTLEPILVKAVATMSEAFYGEQAKRASEATAELKRQVQVLTFRNDELEQYTRQEHYSWNHTTAFGPTFANVLKSLQKNQPNVGDFTFPSVIYWNYTSIVWCLTQSTFAIVCERLLTIAIVC